jgi:arylsulfatase A-like enzyme
MTGLYPHAHGVCSNVHNLGCSVHELNDRPQLLSRRLQAAGYQCGYSGKWHLGTHSTTAFGNPVRSSLPRDVGFRGQNFAGHGGGGFGYPEYRQYLADRGFQHAVRQSDGRPIRVMPYGVLDGPVESTVPYFLAENTIDLIDEFSDIGQPFFIWHNFWGPHAPYYSPQAFYDLYADIPIPEWANYRWPAGEINGPHQVKVHPRARILRWQDWQEGIRHYYAFATLIDQQIGRILDHVDQTGLAENTIVLFTSDHGETLGSHGGLTDKGWHHFEEIQRIPMIVRMPERYTPDGLGRGRVLSEWVSLVDVYPTLLDLAGALSSGTPAHGRSLLPLLRGQDTDWRDTVFVEFNGVNSLATSMVTVRQGTWKYGWNCSNRDELYDLASDPFEMENRIADPTCAGRVRHMRGLIESWMVETGYPGLGMYRQSRIAPLTQ